MAAGAAPAAPAREAGAGVGPSVGSESATPRPPAAWRGGGGRAGWCAVAPTPRNQDTRPTHGPGAQDRRGENCQISGDTARPPGGGAPPPRASCPALVAAPRGRRGARAQGVPSSHFTSVGSAPQRSLTRDVTQLPVHHSSDALHLSPAGGTDD